MIAEAYNSDGWHLNYGTQPVGDDEKVDVVLDLFSDPTSSGRPAYMWNWEIEHGIVAWRYSKQCNSKK